MEFFFDSNRDLSQTSHKMAVEVECKVVFVKIIEIDTKNENFEAEICVECFWFDDDLFYSLLDPNFSDKENNILPIEKSELSDFNLKYLIKNINEIDLRDFSFWKPDIMVDNTIAIQEEEIKYRFEIVEKDSSFSKLPLINRYFENLSIRVTEMKKLKGVFYERLELFNFPYDLQELSIGLSSRLPVEQVRLIESRSDKSRVDRANFFEEQQWQLLDTIHSKRDECNDDLLGFVRSKFIVSAFVVRKYQFYLYNAYMLIMLVTCISLTAFTFPPEFPQLRCQLTSLLLLTLVNFRWILSSSLPSISYLTLIDKFSIGSIIFLFALFIWHTLNASIYRDISTTTGSNQTNVYNRITSEAREYDRNLFYGFLGFYAFFNLVFFILILRILRSINSIKSKDYVMIKKI